jgi:hypothetical protein
MSSICSIIGAISSKLIGWIYSSKVLKEAERKDSELKQPVWNRFVIIHYDLSQQENASHFLIMNNVV